MSKKEKIKNFVKENKKEIAIAGISALVGGVVVYKMTGLSADEKMLLKVVKTYSKGNITGKPFVKNLAEAVDSGKNVHIFRSFNGGVTIDKLGESIVDTFEASDWDLGKHAVSMLIFTDK